MSAKIAATGNGDIVYSEGSIDLPYGIASLSKIWASVLLHERMKQMASKRKISPGALLDESIAVNYDYESAIYSRMDPRPDLQAPDDPLTYKPFRMEKTRFRLPVEKGKTYKIHNLFEAALFQSKNDAIQALSDVFFEDKDNQHFRESSQTLERKLCLAYTHIGDPHGLCDGDNVSTAQDLIKLCVHIINTDVLDFFAQFTPAPSEHTAQALLQDAALAQKGIKILVAKTATGNDRHGNDNAQSLLAIARKGNQFRIALSLSDDNAFNSVAEMLSGA